MADESKDRISIDDLPKPEEELSAEEQNNVTGGLGDGSVRFISESISSNTIGGALTSDVPKKSG